MADLSLFAFTPRSDKATSSSGWELFKGGVVNTLSGNDAIIRVDGHQYGEDSSGHIFNGGLIEMGLGVDSIEGYESAEGGGLVNTGIIKTGAGSDTIIGYNAGFGDGGLINSGLINTGSGNDVVRGRGGYRGTGIDNSGTLYTGPGDDIVDGGGGGIWNDRRISTDTGDDTIIGYEEDYVGIFNAAFINTGDGNDLVESNWIFNAKFGPVGGTIDMGRGDDVINGYVDNDGTIALGDGNDRMINTTYLGNEPHSTWVVGSNSGLISAGAGSDVIGNLEPYSISGNIDMGTGNDTLKGFGIGLFDGGAGIDTLTFAPGTYRVEAVGLGKILINDQMNVHGFERFGQGAGFLSLSDAVALGSVTFV
jgi:Ca2+-binding RTX toxin-like protein